jgi:hypothetical protein
VTSGKTQKHTHTQTTIPGKVWHTLEEGNKFHFIRNRVRVENNQNSLYASATGMLCYALALGTYRRHALQRQTYACIYLETLVKFRLRA